MALIPAPIPAPPFQATSGSAVPAPWTPASGTPLFWVDTPVALAAGRLFTTNAKTVAVTTVADPIGAIVQEGSLGNDLLQSNSSRRYYLTTLADGQYALGSDGIDDTLLSTTVSIAAGAKTVGFRVQYHTAQGSTENDTLLIIGNGTRQTRVILLGTGAAQPGLHFCADITASTVFRRVAAVAPGTTTFNVVIAYNGGANNDSASYRIWVDGTEVTGSLTTGGTNAVYGAFSVLLAASVGVVPCAAKMSKVFMVDGDQSAIVADMIAYLELP